MENKNDVWLWKIQLTHEEISENEDVSWWYELPNGEVEESGIWEDEQVEITIVSFLGD